MISRLFAPFRAFGLGAGLIYSINRILKRIGANPRVYFYEIMVQPVADKPMIAANLSRSFSIREIQRGDPLLESTPTPKKVVKDRFDQGAICLGAFQNEKFIGYQWLCPGPYEEDEVRCLFVPHPDGKAVFDFDIFIFPEHRFGLGFVALWDGANSFMRKRGVEFTTSRVSRFNTQSRRSHDHLGWKRFGRAWFLSGRKLQVMLATLPPYVNFSGTPESRPQIVIRTAATSDTAE